MPTFAVLFDTVGLIQPGGGVPVVPAQPSMGCYEFDVQGAHPYSLTISYAAYYQAHVEVC